MLSLSPASMATENTHHPWECPTYSRSGKHIPVLDLAEMAPEQTDVLHLDQTVLWKDMRKFIMLDRSLVLL